MVDVEILPAPVEVTAAEIPLVFYKGDLHVVEIGGKIALEVSLEDANGNPVGLGLGIGDALSLMEILRVGIQQAGLEAQGRAQRAAQEGEA